MALYSIHSALHLIRAHRANVAHKGAIWDAIISCIGEARSVINGIQQRQLPGGR